MASIRRILFASDFSKASGKAFAAAVSLSKSLRAPLTILHVVAPLTPVTPDQYLGPDTWQQIEADARRWAAKKLAGLSARAGKAGVRAAVMVVEGSPAKQIVGIAKAKRSDLLVIGTHGRTGLAKFFLGSVAGRIVATAPCPVLTVRGKE